MGRINLKSVKSDKKFRTRLVKISYHSDYYELHLVSTGKTVEVGSLSKVSKVRQYFENNSDDPVQLELF